MRKITTIFAIISLYLTSCGGHDDNNNVSPSPSLNNTEQQLVGTWYLQKTTDSVSYDSTYWGNSLNDTVYTYSNYPSQDYIEFSSQLATTGQVGQTYLQGTDACMLLDGWIYTGALGSSLGIVTPAYWYFDNSTNILVWFDTQYTIVSLTGNQLVLRHYFNIIGETSVGYWYFKKG